MESEVEVSVSSSPLIPGLPDDVAIICLAKIPLAESLRLHSVSKSWRRVLTCGAVYQIKRCYEWLQNFLVIFDDIERTSSGYSLPIKFLDPRKLTVIKFPSLVLPLGCSNFSLYKCLSSGPDVYVMGIAWNTSESTYQQNLWIFRGATRKWVVVNEFLNSGESWFCANVVDGALLVFFMKRENEFHNTLFIKKFSENGCWVCNDSCLGITVTDFSSGSIVKDGKVHFLLEKPDSFSFHLSFDPTKGKWDPQSQEIGGDDESFYAMAEKFPLALVRNTLFGIWWVENRNRHQAAKVMRFDEDCHSWVLLTVIPNRGTTKGISEYMIEGMDDKLFVLECKSTSQSVTGLYILRIEERGTPKKEFSCEWEVINYPLGGHPLSCSTIHI